MRILLLGLGRANLSIAKYLIERGDDLFLYEDNLEMISEPARELIKIGKIQMYQEENYELTITSPGFPLEKKVIKELRSKNIPIIDEIEFTYGQLKNPQIIAITTIFLVVIFHQVNHFHKRFFSQDLNTMF
jgi:UDP-N-acetylmuramoylalanine-D-glutamate ligase